MCLVLWSILTVKHIAIPWTISAGKLPNALSPSFLQKTLINCHLTGGPKPKTFLGKEGLILVHGAKMMEVLELDTYCNQEQVLVFTEMCDGPF